MLDYIRFCCKYMMEYASHNVPPKYCWLNAYIIFEIILFIIHTDAGRRITSSVTYLFNIRLAAYGAA